MSTTAAPVADLASVGWRLEDTYTRLPAVLWTASTPAKVRSPQVTILNHKLGAELGLDLAALAPERAAAVFAGQELPPGARPLAQAYAGHQFGGFTVLGDGRAILLGEQRTPDGRLCDVQLKGPGRTRYSRGGDGRAALGPMLREYVVSEALAALGIPTTRSLAVVTTGEPVYRETVRKGAVLTRVAASHLRVGTFEFAAALGDEEALRALADYATARHYPELADGPGKYLAFFRAVADRQAELVARWLAVGFVHGVMNTDNVAISGESIDFGPCAFMNAYDPATVFSSIDRGGRYAYGNQPAITQWNLARFAEALLPLVDADQQTAIGAATAVLEEFPAVFERHRLAAMRAKLGLQSAEDGDAELVQSLLAWMGAARADWTNTFRDLSEGDPSGGRYDDADFRAWLAQWQERQARDGRPAEAARAAMRAVNPAVIPRNHRVEEALAAAEERDDLAPLHRLLAALAAPFDGRPEFAEFRDPPRDECGYRTFCGT